MSQLEFPEQRALAGVARCDSKRAAQTQAEELQADAQLAVSMLSLVEIGQSLFQGIGRQCLVQELV